MSTRALVIIKDEDESVQFYRHSDGYPEHTGKDLIDFVQGYATGAMRLSAMQSGGWLVIRGHAEYLDGGFTAKPGSDECMGWKCGAYEPTSAKSADETDVQYTYTIDLQKCTLTCSNAKAMPTVKFKVGGGK